MPALPTLSANFLYSLLESIDEIVIVTEIEPIDAPGPTIVYVNQAFTDITGYTYEEAVGKSPRILQGPGTDRTALDRIKHAMQQHRECREEVLNYHKDGTAYWLHMHIVPLPDETGKARYFAAIERDITVQRHQTERLLHLAHRDVLTGLPNRGALEEKFTALIASKSTRGHALVLLDLDEFKQVNDTYGHVAGDELLRMFAALLLSSLRRDDFVARLGGDEFVILLADTPLEEARAIAQKVVHASRELAFKNHAQTQFGASAGVTALSWDEDLNSTITRADKSLYDAKSQRKGAVKCAACRDGQALNFDFTMAFQPILDLDTGRPYAYEALVRGLNGESAASILDQVNAANMYQFDQSCRVKAIELASNLGLQDLPDCKLSINFLPNAVYRPAACIQATLKAASQFKFPLERLMFEVTEGEQLDDPAHLVSIFEEYHRHGFTTAIDDFGAGYSGLNLLARFQPHVLKLDMELTRDIDSNPVRQAIVTGILVMARKLNIVIIAEGIETQAECDQLRSLGVRYMQGYLFARPTIGKLL